jgi:hypothetical protein
LIAKHRWHLAASSNNCQASHGIAKLREYGTVRGSENSLQHNAAASEHLAAQDADQDAHQGREDENRQDGTRRSDAKEDADESVGDNEDQVPNLVVTSCIPSDRSREHAEIRGSGSLQRLDIASKAVDHPANRHVLPPRHRGI